MHPGAAVRKRAAERRSETGRSLEEWLALVKNTIVPLYREHVFAQIKPTTNSRVDFGLALTHLQREIAQATDGYRRAGQKRPYHASN
ncbi:MAG: hypothetical protein DMG38_19690 [Acidobacteria bacterium]|nr:MAG: hypothetical protein DMG38_19690 [Acidobacteriota bacterium]